MSVAGGVVGRMIADGVLDEDGKYPAVKITGDSSLTFGTGVAIASRWILTASHLFRGPQLRVRVKTWHGRDEVSVRAIHWQGVSYEFPPRSQPFTPPSWPADVDDLRGERDQPVLLELEEAIDLGSVARLDADGYVPDEKLHVVGYGIDGEGNYQANEISAIARMVGVDAAQSQFGRCRSDPENFPRADMPRHDDSGAPVFRADSLNLVGIHSLRERLKSSNPPQEIETAHFIPITQSVCDWIRKCIGDDLTRPRPVAPRQQRFVLRRSHACLTLAAGARSLDGTWYLSVPSGNPSVLRLCDRIQISSGKFNLYRCGSSTSIYQGNVRPGGDKKVPTAWLHVDHVAGKTRVEFYIFRRTDGLLPIVLGNGTILYEPRRRIHIEVFKGGSLHDRPDGNLELGGAVADPPEIPPCIGCIMTGNLVPAIDDQDDEGDAYEG